MEHFENTLLNFSRLELENAESILRVMEPTFSLTNKYHNIIAHGEKFEANYHGGAVTHSQFYDCVFTDVDFTGMAGISSIFKCCDIRGCRFEDACLDFSDFSSTSFEPSEKQVEITSCNLMYTDLTETLFDQVTCSSCSFMNSRLEKTRFVNSKLVHCSFENSSLYDSIFENMDLSHVSFEFSDCRNISFKNVKLPYFGILQSFGGLNILATSCPDARIKFANSDIDISVDEYLNQMEAIKAYFYYKSDFFTLANICIFLGEQESAHESLLHGILYALRSKDFRMIRNLCKLASNNHFFSKRDLYTIFETLLNSHLTSSMTAHQNQVYLYELDRLKHFLVDRPYDLSQMIMTLKTDIDFMDAETNAKLIKFLNIALEKIAPQSHNYITLRHNSPTTFEIIISDYGRVLLEYFFSVGYYLYGAGIVSSQAKKVISHFYDIQERHIELKMKKKLLENMNEDQKDRQLERKDKQLDIKLKEEKLRMKKRESKVQEKMMKQLIARLEDGEDHVELSAMVKGFKDRVQAIEYRLKTDEPIPPDIVGGIIQKSKKPDVKKRLQK